MPSFVFTFRECARALNDLGGPYPVASATNASLRVARLINTATGASPTDYDERYLYISSGTGVGQCVRAKSNGFDPTDGEIAIAQTAWTTNPSTDSLVDITSLFPAKGATAGEDGDYLSLINQALSLIDIPRVLAPAITTSGDHALTTWVAWIRPERIRRQRMPGPYREMVEVLDVREPSPVSGHPNIIVPTRGWEYIGDEDTPKLRTHAPFASASGTLEVHCVAPAWSWVKSGGTWGEGAGFVNETDEVLPELGHIVDVFLPLAYRNLMNRQPGAPSDPQALKKFTDALDRARSVPGYNRAAERRAMPEVAALEAAA